MAVKKKKANSAFMRPLEVSEDLEAVVGKGPMPRTEVTKKLWVYIKKHKLQDPSNLRNIKPDEKLAKVFGSKKTIDMFQMTKLVSKHLE
jgi:chromatin remodeling complex protein RSC6